MCEVLDYSLDLYLTQQVKKPLRYHTNRNHSPPNLSSGEMRHYLGLVSLIQAVTGHGNMNLPIPRNNDGQYPANTAPGNSHGPSW